MKCKSNHLYLKMALILSSDINFQMKDLKFEAFDNEELDFFSSKIGLRNIAKCSNPAVIGITKTKLKNTVYDSEVTKDGYNIVRNDRDRKDGGVTCYIRSNICCSRKACLSDILENISLIFCSHRQNLYP